MFYSGFECALVGNTCQQVVHGGEKTGEDRVNGGHERMSEVSQPRTASQECGQPVRFRPGQQDPGTVFGKPATPHPIGNQAAFIYIEITVVVRQSPEPAPA